MSRMMRLCLSAVLLALCVDAMPPFRNVNTENHDYRVVCYFTNWAQYRPGSARFVAANMDPSLCTHIIFAFAKLSDSRTNRLEPYEWNDESTDYMVGNYEAVNNLKQTNPALKTLLAVGGWSHGVAKFTYMAETAERRQVFIQDAIQFLRQRNFDGLDLDWEFPGAINRGSPAIDKQRFTLLVQELRAAFEEEAAQTGRERLLLSSACAAGPSYIANGYEISAISSSFDFINLMAYDLHGSWETTTGHHTALYPGDSDFGNNLLLTVSNAVDIWLEGGTPPSKLVLGMGLYGRSFTLRGQQTGIGAPVSGPGTPGVSTREDGFLSYYEICNKLQDGQLTRVWDVRRRVPYAFHGNQWVGYDDKRSIRVKVDFLKEKGLGGAMVWAIDLDDFNGDCGETWPLMKAINRRLAFDATSSPATDELVTDPPATDAPATNAPATNVPATEISATDTPATDARITDALATDALSTDAPATNAPAGDVSATNVPATDGRITDALATNALSTDAPATNASSRTHSPDAGTFTCRDKPNGYYADPNSCRMYYICNQGVASYLPCGTGLYFDPQTYTCNYPGNVQCNAPDTPLFCDDRADGHYADPADCSKFYQCANGFTYLTSCQDGLLWNSHINSCDWPRNVKCDRNEVFSCDGREHGYYGDPSDCAGYYHCAGGKTYRFSCGDLYWNGQVGGCDYPSNVQCTV